MIDESHQKRLDLKKKGKPVKPVKANAKRKMTYKNKKKKVEEENRRR